MIDIENFVFNEIATALRAKYSNIYVIGEYAETVPRFPAVTIIEADNRPVTRWRTCENMENAADVTYRANIYSNKTKGKKQEAKDIANYVVDCFQALGFTREFFQQIPNLNDATIYRIECRFSGRVIPNDDGRYYIHATQ